MAAAEILGVLDLRQRVASSASAVAEVVAARLEEWRQARSRAQFRAMELEVAGVAREFADEVVEHLLRDMLSDREFVVPRVWRHVPGWANCGMVAGVRLRSSCWAGGRCPS
jgi:hypothetical protein